MCNIYAKKYRILWNCMEKRPHLATIEEKLLETEISRYVRNLSNKYQGKLFID